MSVILKAMVEITNLLKGASRVVTSSEECSREENIGFHVARNFGPHIEDGTAYIPVDWDRLEEGSEYHSQFR
jgi:hypothetical protein